MKDEIKYTILDIGRSLLIEIISTLIMILAFAVVLKFVDCNTKIIIIVNGIIKTLSIVIGLLFGIKNSKNGLIKGLLSGAIYILFALIIFGVFDNFESVNFNVYDLLLGIFGGAFAGILKVNLLKE